MKTVSIRLNDTDFEELNDILDAMGQTKQTFFETYVKTVLRERRIPFVVEAPRQDSPKALDEMTKTEFDQFIAKGLEDSIANRITPAKVAFEELLKEYR